MFWGSHVSLSCGVGLRCSLDPILRWLAAAALIQPLAWELSYAVGVALKSKQTNKHSFIFLFFIFGLFWTAPTAYGGSQAMGPFGAVAAGLCHSHINPGSEPCLQCVPQLTMMPGP